MGTSQKHAALEQTLSAHFVQALWIKVLLWMRHFSRSSQVCTSWHGIGHAGVDNQGCYMRSLINMVLFAVIMNSRWNRNSFSSQEWTKINAAVPIMSQHYFMITKAQTAQGVGAFFHLFFLFNLNLLSRLLFGDDIIQLPFPPRQ